MTKTPPFNAAGALPLFCVLALALRLWGITWGLPSATHYFSYHPDESVVLETSSLTMNVFAGRLLPHYYNYPSLQLYLVCFTNTLAALFGAVDIVPKNFAQWYPQWAKMYLVGRLLTVGMGVGTVWVTYTVGATVWGRRAGLAAALILATMPLHAQQSHFLTVDVPATFWVMLSLLWSVRLATDYPKPLKAALLAGLFAGFAAATLKRGMRFVQVPTSLLAQVDSSVGGKTGINAPQGKNLVGAFHQPVLVLADTDCLDTLSPREFRAGYAEVAKYGLIDDAPFFDWLDENRDAVFAGGANGAEARRHAIAQSCRAKAAVVARDEHERGDRALLNLGHTFGHALERLTAYDGARLVHGEAVAIGVALAFRFSARLGLCPAEDAGRVERHFRAAGLPTRIGDVPGWADGADAVLDAMMQDKKVTRGRLNLILARGIGRSFVAPDVDAAAVRDFLDGEMAKG